MDKYESLEEKLRRREMVVGSTITVIESTVITEELNRAGGLDFQLFDMEHGVFNNENLVANLQVCRLMGMPALVRVPDAVYHFIARAMDLGADGIMLPRTETVEQVKLAVDAMRFYPTGRTGCGGHGQFRPGESMAHYQKHRYLVPQIESPKGIKNLPAMLEAYGEEIAAVVIGPYDLSVMLGVPEQFDSPHEQEAIQRVFDICAAHGKSCGIFCNDETGAARYRAMGANVIWTCHDVRTFLRGYEALMAGLDKLR